VYHQGSQKGQKEEAGDIQIGQMKKRFDRNKDEEQMS
jgi:hypothetical protein